MEVCSVQSFEGPCFMYRNWPTILKFNFNSSKLYLQQFLHDLNIHILTIQDPLLFKYPHITVTKLMI